MKKIHTIITRLHNSDSAILLVRSALGITFIHAGWLKFENMDMVINGFGQAGLVPIFAFLVSGCEFLFGILMLLGIAVRYSGIVLSIIMLVAMIKVHLPNGYGLQNGGYEYVLVLFLISLSTVVSGAGKYSISEWWKNRKTDQPQEESLFDSTN